MVHTPDPAERLTPVLFGRLAAEAMTAIDPWPRSSRFSGDLMVDVDERIGCAADRDTGDVTVSSGAFLVLRDLYEAPDRTRTDADRRQAMTAVRTVLTGLTELTCEPGAEVDRPSPADTSLLTATEINPGRDGLAAGLNEHRAQQRAVDFAAEVFGPSVAAELATAEKMTSQPHRLGAVRAYLIVVLDRDEAAMDELTELAVGVPDDQKAEVLVDPVLRRHGLDKLLAPDHLARARTEAASLLTRECDRIAEYDGQPTEEAFRVGRDAGRDAAEVVDRYCHATAAIASQQRVIDRALGEATERFGLCELDAAADLRAGDVEGARFTLATGLLAFGRSQDEAAVAQESLDRTLADLSTATATEAIGHLQGRRDHAAREHVGPSARDDLAVAGWEARLAHERQQLRTVRSWSAERTDRTATWAVDGGINTEAATDLDGWELPADRTDDLAAALEQRGRDRCVAGRALTGSAVAFGADRDQLVTGPVRPVPELAPRTPARPTGVPLDPRGPALDGLPDPSAATRSKPADTGQAASATGTDPRSREPHRPSGPIR